MATSDVEGPRLTAQAPAPLRPGTVKLEMTGAVEIDVSGAGVLCPRDAEDPVDLHAREFLGPFGSARWFLSFGARPPATSIEVYFVQDVEQRHPETLLLQTTETPSDTFRGLASGGEWSYSGPAAAQDGKTVDIKMHVTCPEPVGGSTPDPAVIEFLETLGDGPAPYHSDHAPSRGDPRAAFVFVDSTKVDALVTEARRRLGPGWVAFAGGDNTLERSNNPGAPRRTQLVVGPGANQYDILRIADTDAANYGLLTEAVIRQLKRWDTRYGLEIVQATGSTFSARVRRPDGDLLRLATELIQLCPDPDFVPEDAPKIAREISENGTIGCWWD